MPGCGSRSYPDELCVTFLVIVRRFGDPGGELLTTPFKGCERQGWRDQRLQGRIYAVP